MIDLALIVFAILFHIEQRLEPIRIRHTKANGSDSVHFFVLYTRFDITGIR